MKVLDRDALRLFFSRPFVGLALFAGVMAVAGCSTKPLVNDPELATRPLGDVTLRIAEHNTVSGEPNLIKAYAKYDENQLFRHWRHQFQYSCVTCNGRQAVLLDFLSAYKPYCQAQGGSWVISERYQDGFFASGTCGKPDNPMIFSVFPSFNSRPHRETTLYFILADSFQAKGPGSMKDLRSLYVAERVNVPSTFRFRIGNEAWVSEPWAFYGWQEDTQEWAAARKATKAAELEAGALQFREQMAQRKAWEVKAKQAGVQVCRTIYPLSGTGSFKIFGTTLPANGDKLTIRIQSIREYGRGGQLIDAHSRVTGNALAPGQPRQDVFYQVGDTVSEAASGWDPC